VSEKPDTGSGRGLTELYTEPTFRSERNWEDIVQAQHCRYIGKRCAKRRKTEPDISIGTCTVQYHVKNPKQVIICPFRFLERRQVFTHCLHLLTHSEPGDEHHVVSEVTIPGGSVDYCLVATRKGRVVDFVGIELQAVDTTGTVWPTRQRFLSSLSLAEVLPEDKGYGMNWKMSGKTILMQLHHKVETFEHVGRHFVLVLQDHFLEEMIKSFSFGHVGPAKIGDTMHFHSYSLTEQTTGYTLELTKRISTDSAGVQKSLGNAVESRVELAVILSALQEKIDKALYDTLLTVADSPAGLPTPTADTKPELLQE
jgi:hypothetical protein